MSSIPLAELIIENVTVITMDPEHPFATGIAIANGRILGLINENDKTWPLASNGKRINGQSSTLLPGLIDAHCHLRAQISYGLSVPCDQNNTSSITGIIAKIHEKACSLPNGTWIRASGYDPFYLNEKRHPLRWDLDKATSDHPIRLRHVTRHVSVLNSAALCLAGIGPNTVDPAGMHVERLPESGTPTGLIYGGDAWLSQHVLPALSSHELEKGARSLQRFLLSKGITAVQDATPTSGKSDLEFWASQIQKGWYITIQMMSGEKNHADMTATIAQEVPPDAKHQLEMGPVKIVMEANQGISPQPSELKRIASSAVRRNVPIAVHVVNPEMVWSAIDAIDYANQYGKKNIRHRLEHLSLCPDSFLHEIAKKNIMAVTNPNLIYNHGDRYLANVENSELGWLYKMRSVEQSNIHLAAGSDAPVASTDPWTGIQTACTRKTISGYNLNSEEKLERWQALSMYTSKAALAGSWEHCRGMIRPGYFADLIALDRNPLTCPVNTIGNTQVQATWIRGKLVYHSSFW